MYPSLFHLVYFAKIWYYVTNISLGCAGMKVIKKLISVALSVIIVISLFTMNANAVSTGNIGVNETNIVWSLDDEGNLTVSGTGEMKSLNNYYTFDGVSNKIKTVIIEDGIINIGSYIFSLCENMSSISIPVSVTEIGKFAFAEASTLKNVYYEGTKSQWDEIRIETEGNTYLSNAKINFNEESHICSYETVVNTLEPTCVTDGTVTKVCSCGNKNTTKIPATGVHKYKWTITAEAHCLTDGEETQLCTVCNEMGETRKINKTGHKSGEWIESNNPTCTDKGLKVKRCENCGEILEQEEIAPTGHDFGEWKITIKENEDHNGEEKRTCKNCKYEETRIIDNIKSDDEILVGDVNEDGNITAVDARIILQIVAGLRSADSVNAEIADVNKDEKITAVDARFILQIVAGLK